MENSSLLDGLRKLGLTEPEAKGYLALIERDTMSASEIAKISNLNRTTTYDILNNLMDRGLCSLIPGKVKKYRALDIDYLAEDILEGKKKEFQEINTQINDVCGEISLKLKRAHEQNQDEISPLEYVEVLRNPSNIHRNFLQLNAKAQSSVLAFSKPPFARGTKEEIAEQYHIQDVIRGRGVKIKNIHEIPLEEALEKYKNTKPQENVESRIIDKLPMKLFIFDDRISLFTLEDPIPDRASLTMFKIDHPALTESLKATFYTYWEKAINIESEILKK